MFHLGFEKVALSPSTVRSAVGKAFDLAHDTPFDKTNSWLTHSARKSATHAAKNYAHGTAHAAGRRKALEELKYLNRKRKDASRFFLW